MRVMRWERLASRWIREHLPQLAMAGLAAGWACGAASPTEPAVAHEEHSMVADVAAKVAQAAAAVTGQDAKIADNYEKGHYVGFDTHTYPGTRVMKTWKDTPGSPYSWVGYYLPSPCHDDKSWTGKRDTLAAMGWGVAIVYVGEQTWGKIPRTLSLAQRDVQRKKSDCSTDLISAEEGTLNADEATERTKAEGFAPGSVVFLDLERMETIPPAMRAYYRAWAARMLKNGVYVPGFYAHQHNAQQVFSDVSEEFKAAGNTTEPRFWIAGGKSFDEGRAPQDVGYNFAGMWQGVIDVARSVANIRLPVDVNVGAWASPSESGTGTK
jgi:hypothetical protein